MVLEKLTKEQVKLMFEVRKEWIDRFNSLEFDEEKSKKLVSRLYEITGIEPPEIIILDSPMSLQIACNMLSSFKYSDKSNQVHHQVYNQISSQVKNQVNNQVSDQVSNQVWNQVYNQLYNQMYNQVNNEVYNQVSNQVYNQVNNQINNQVGEQLYNQVNNQINNQIRNQVRNQINNQVYNQVSNQVWNQVSSQVYNQVYNQVSNQVWNQVKNQLKYYNEAWYGPSNDLHWFGFYDYFSRIGILKNVLFQEFKELIKCGIFIMIQTEKICLVSRPPVFLNRDEDNNMHSTETAAIEFADGFKLHYVHGVFFNENDFTKFVKGKKALGKDIMTVTNAEQKAALIKIYGYDKILSELPYLKILDKYTEKSKIDNKEKEVILYEYKFNERIDARILKMTDHSSNKDYFLGIPIQGNTNTAKEAMLWTWGIDNYQPEVQS